MTIYNIEFLHSDGSIRKTKIEAFDEDRAKERFLVNWGYDMKLLIIKATEI